MLVIPDPHLRRQHIAAIERTIKRLVEVRRVDPEFVVDLTAGVLLHDAPAFVQVDLDSASHLDVGYVLAVLLTDALPSLDIVDKAVMAKIVGRGAERTIFRLIAFGKLQFLEQGYGPGAIHPAFGAGCA